MQFLVDTNLPKAMAVWLAEKGHACDHVLQLGLAQAKDSELWRRAGETGAIIVSKDEDFADLARRTISGPSAARAMERRTICSDSSNRSGPTSKAAY